MYKHLNLYFYALFSFAFLPLEQVNLLIIFAQLVCK